MVKFTDYQFPNPHEPEKKVSKQDIEARKRKEEEEFQLAVIQCLVL